MKLNVTFSSSRLFIISKIYFELKPISNSAPEYSVTISSVAKPLSESAEVLYKTTSFWSRACERSIRWNDPGLRINWPLDESLIHLSEKDRQAPLLEELSDKEVFE